MNSAIVVASIIFAYLAFEASMLYWAMRAARKNGWVLGTQTDFIRFRDEARKRR